MSDKYEGIVFGLLPAEEQKRLMASKKQIQHYTTNCWQDSYRPTWNGNVAYREAPEPAKRLADLDWSTLDPVWKLAAVDEDGEAFAYESKPDIMTCAFYPSGRTECAKILGRFDASDWKNSLIWRPESKAQPKAQTKTRRPYAGPHECPAPMMVRRKEWEKGAWEYVHPRNGRIFTPIGGSLSYEELAETCEYHDGSYCGVEE
jgi:hypothetical protein